MGRITWPLIVTGTGRSGTSFVARLLHERLGVCMGVRFAEPSRACPDGDYEDIEAREATFRLERGIVSPSDWLSFLDSHTWAWPLPWGLKSPHYATHLEALVGQWPTLTVIWCRRELEAALESRRRFAGWGEAARTMARAYDALESFFEGGEGPGRFVLDFDEHQEEAEMIPRLAGMLGLELPE